MGTDYIVSIVYIVYIILYILLYCTEKHVECEWELTVLSNIVRHTAPFGCTRQVSNFQCCNWNGKQPEPKVATLTWAFCLVVDLQALGYIHIFEPSILHQRQPKNCVGDLMYIF